MNKSLLTSLFIPLSLAISSLASAQLISNGGFESAIVPGGSGTGNWGSFNNGYRETVGFARTGTGTAKLFSAFSGDGTSGLYQNFTATVGQSFTATGFGYNLSDDRMQGGSAAFLKLIFQDASGAEINPNDPNKVSASITANTPTNTYVPLSVTGVAPAGTARGQILLLFTQPAPFVGGATFFDDVNVAPVPEPATLAVLGLGLVPFLRRRRK